jgi:hypothetical protein
MYIFLAVSLTFYKETVFMILCLRAIFNQKMETDSSRRFLFHQLSGDLVNKIAKYLKISLSAMISYYV